MKDTLILLRELIDDAISGNGFIELMSQKTPNDIPMAFEMYTLLGYFLEKLPLKEVKLQIGATEISLEQTILYDMENSRVIALISVNENELQEIAYWLADGIPSSLIKEKSGILALPFSIEKHNDEPYLIPEWFAVLYIDQDPEQFIPLLTLKSILNNEQFGGDWVDIALKRMDIFSLPKR